MYVVPLFKLMQQQTIGEVENSITFCGHIISVCNSEELLKWDSICHSYAQMKMDPVLFWLTVYLLHFNTNIFQFIIHYYWPNAVGL